MRDLSPAGSASVPLDLDVVFLVGFPLLALVSELHLLIYADMLMISAALLLLLFFDAAMASLLFFV
jgi:hypothetical protein